MTSTDTQKLDRCRRAVIPEGLLDGEVPDFNDFLEQRRQLMAQKIKTWLEAL
jgi:hypothetical protein